VRFTLADGRAVTAAVTGNFYSARLPAPPAADNPTAAEFTLLLQRDPSPHEPWPPRAAVTWLDGAGHDVPRQP
jgi:hypothetical protein